MDLWSSPTVSQQILCNICHVQRWSWPRRGRLYKPSNLGRLRACASLGRSTVFHVLYFKLSCQTAKQFQCDISSYKKLILPCWSHCCPRKGVYKSSKSSGLQSFTVNHLQCSLAVQKREQDVLAQIGHFKWTGVGSWHLVVWPCMSYQLARPWSSYCGSMQTDEVARAISILKTFYYIQIGW